MNRCYTLQFNISLLHPYILKGALFFFLSSYCFVSHYHTVTTLKTSIFTRQVLPLIFGTVEMLLQQRLLLLKWKNKLLNYNYYYYGNLKNTLKKED